MTDVVDPLLDEDPPDDPAAVERRADALLAAAFSGTGDVFDSQDAKRLAASKKAADRLVELKLARYSDEGRTHIEPTNAGRYWAMNGGYMAFLREAPPGGGGGGRNQNPEFQALRMNYMKLRMSTFWLTFGLSIAGFIISLISLAVAALTGQPLIHR